VTILIYRQLTYGSRWNFYCSTVDRHLPPHSTQQTANVRQLVVAGAATYCGNNVSTSEIGIAQICVAYAMACRLAPPRRTSRVRGALYGAKAVRSGVQGGGGSQIFVLRSPPSVPPCHKCSANSGPRAQASFFFPLLSTRYVSGARCIPKRITYTAGAFSIV